MKKTTRQPKPTNSPEYVHVEDILDLHGFFPEQIPEMVEEFIKNAKRLNLKKLRIIHGKGRSRLKYEVLGVLRTHHHVAAFYDAPPELGHWGATIVELKE